MKKLIITSFFFFLFTLLNFFCSFGFVTLHAQSVQLKDSLRETLQGISLRGEVKNYAMQPLWLYKCGVYPDNNGGKDTLLLVDSTVIDAKGKFRFQIPNPKS